MKISQEWYVSGAAPPVYKFRVIIALISTSFTLIMLTRIKQSLKHPTLRHVDS